MYQVQLNRFAAVPHTFNCIKYTYLLVPHRPLNTTRKKTASKPHPTTEADVMIV